MGKHPDKEKWEALAEKELRGKPLDSLTWQSPEGIAVKPLYTAEDLDEIEFNNTLPGMDPFVRGVRGTMYTGRPWTIRQYAGFSTAKESNAFYKRNLAAGQKGLSIAFECDTYGGSLNGSVFIAEKRTDSPLTVNAEIDGLKMEEWEAGRLLLGRRIDGSLSGRLEVNQVSGSFMNGTGTASFHVSGGKVQLLQQGSGLDELRFEDLLLKMGLDNGRIDLERAEVSGGDVKGSLSGTITINRRSIIRSPVNLTGSAEILDVLISRSGAAGESLRFFKRQMKKGRLSFVIRGTIQSPSLRFR